MFGLSSVIPVGCIRLPRRPRRRRWISSGLYERLGRRGRHIYLQLFQCEALKYFGRKQIFQAGRTNFNLLLSLSECYYLSDPTWLSKPFNKLVKLLSLYLHRRVTRRGDIMVPGSIGIVAVFLYHFQKPFLCYWLLDAFTHAWNIKDEAHFINRMTCLQLKELGLTLKDTAKHL